MILTDGEIALAILTLAGAFHTLRVLSEVSFDEVKVHNKSDKPAQLHALAYTQGTDIYVASGQEKHLAHEAWHVVQQGQGRTKNNNE